MSEQPSAPIIIKEIPSQIINEGASFGPLNLSEHIQSLNEISGTVKFQAELTSGAPLPKGLICTTAGIISGIPASGTQGAHEVLITASNDSGASVTAQFLLTIKERIAIEPPESFAVFKNKVWDALKKNLPLPEMSEIFERPISAVELYYLLERFAVLTIWDVYNLEMPAEKKLLQLPGASKHFNLYDRGSCLVAAPKDLFSHERTVGDALESSRVLAREVYKRGWTIEMSGFNKMTRAAWVELQLLGDKHGKHLDILRYDPTADDLRIYTEQAKVMALNSGMNL